MNPAPYLWACWIVFALFWLLRAAATKATVERQPLAARLASGVPLLLGIVLLVRPALWPPLGRMPLPWSAALAVGGVGRCALGLAVALWARQTLGANWSGRVTFKQDHELVMRGPYRLARHPIYTGLLLMALGTAVASDRLGALLGCLCFLVALAIKIGQEERLMMRHFPDAYGAYRSRVKALVPYLW
jgi:protein-S-isoprenylcysteine O-methyltransferase Ste14